MRTFYHHVCRTAKGTKLMEMLRLENVYKTYGIGAAATAALKNVSLSVEEGEFVAVIGSSGSGKSTLLHTLGGVDKPTRGKVIIDGQDIYAMDDKTLSDFRCRTVGMVYQFFNLIPVLNVEENISFPLLMAEKAVDHTRIKSLLSMLNLSAKTTSMPNQLSGGQQQRVAIGRALVNAPRLILADEPTGNLDSRNARDIMELLRKSSGALKTTLIVVTHSEKIAAQADRIIEIEDGEILSDSKQAGGGI